LINAERCVNFDALFGRIESYILTTVHDFRAFESVKGGAFMNIKVAQAKFAPAFINTSRGVNIFILKMYSGVLKVSLMRHASVVSSLAADSANLNAEAQYLLS
jgi:hypothetical protein